MNKLKVLDLGFNELTGRIPASFAQFDKADFMYLTGNKLTGTILAGFLEKVQMLMFLTITLAGRAQVRLNVQEGL